MLGQVRTAAKTTIETQFPWTLHKLRVLKYIYWRPYQPEIALVKALVKPGTDGADVGANIGLFSWQISRFARRCYCFEPQPSLAAYLKKALPGNCTVVPSALSDHVGTADLKLPWIHGRYDEGQASLDAVKTAQFTDTKTVAVALETLDRAVTTPVSFLNIDVEGYEIHVLRGGVALFKSQRPSVLVEIEERHNPHSFGQVTAFFRDLGYSGFFYREGTLKPLSTFDPRRDQDVARVGTEAYINNFLFLADEAPRPKI